MLKTATDKVKANVIGTIAGAGLTYFAVKKYKNNKIKAPHIITPR
jgi:hypothetical protein